MFMQHVQYVLLFFSTGGKFLPVWDLYRVTRSYSSHPFSCALGAYNPDVVITKFLFTDLNYSQLNHFNKNMYTKICNILVHGYPWTRCLMCTHVHVYTLAVTFFSLTTPSFYSIFWFYSCTLMLHSSCIYINEMSLTPTAIINACKWKRWRLFTVAIRVFYVQGINCKMNLHSSDFLNLTLSK